MDKTKNIVIPSGNLLNKINTNDGKAQMFFDYKKVFDRLRLTTNFPKLMTWAVEGVLLRRTTNGSKLNLINENTFCCSALIS